MTRQLIDWDTGQGDRREASSKQVTGKAADGEAQTQAWNAQGFLGFWWIFDRDRSPPAPGPGGKDTCEGLEAK